MRALTIRQPWAGAIAHQTKRVENRSWKLPAKHHGARILIHAGAQPDRDAQVYGEHLDVYSAVVAIATVSGCHWSDDGTCCGPWGFEQVYHWTLTDVTALPEPVPCKGRLGFWTPDDKITEAVTAQAEPRQEETNRLRTAHEGSCHYCGKAAMLFHFQREQQPWEEAEPPVRWLCVPCWGSAQATVEATGSSDFNDVFTHGSDDQLSRFVFGGAS